MSDTFVVSNEAQLNAALTAIDLTGSLSVPGTDYTISFSNSFTLATELYAINLASGDTLTIQGNGYTLDGDGVQRGFFVYAGDVDINALAIDSMVATGGAGGVGDLNGGGGAGLGGGLFIAAAGTVTLSDVSFADDNAVGGRGVGGFATDVSSAGGGGLGGNAGAFLGGGGGIGQSAVGGIGAFASGAGIVLGAASAGTGGGDVSSGVTGGSDGGGGGGGSFGLGTAAGGGGGIGGQSATVGASSGANGGFGGGGGGGGNGGFGGGGGGGGDGGFGGGGGANAYSPSGGLGGFGGGNGSGLNAGGGLGAGGAVFVQQGGALSYGAGADAGGSVVGGAGGTLFPGDGYFGPVVVGQGGSAYGSGIFLQGNEQITLDPAAGQTLTFDDVIADQTGSGGTGNNAGAGSLLIDGAGTVVLAADNTFSGGITLVSGELDLATPGAAGSGPIAIGDAAALLIGANDFTFEVGSEADLNNVLQQIDLTGSLSAPATDYMISFSNSFTLTSELYAVNLASGDTLTIQGNGDTLDGGGAQRGFFVYAGTVGIDNLAIDDAVATGGDGGSGYLGGGGGAGLGGGLFIAAAGNVTLAGVTFAGDSAAGGNGGASTFTNGVGFGGGGGLGGAGGSGEPSSDGGGGGIGLTATGGSAGAGGPGIVIGAASGGQGAGGVNPGGSDGGGGGAGTHFLEGLNGDAGSGGIETQNVPGIIQNVGGFGGGGGGGEPGNFGGGGSGGGGFGGFGGGAGGGDSAGGFGGGGADDAAAGGGLGAGGAIFVEGGSLSYGGGSDSGGSVTGGAAGTTPPALAPSASQLADLAGSALGAGIFLAGGRVTLDPGAGQTLTLNDVIADDLGGSLLIDGAGTVVLAADNTFTGGITIAGGTLDLAGIGAAGSGPLSFAPDADPLLQFDPVDVPTNPIEDLGPGDTIEITGFVPFGSIYVNGTFDLAGLTPAGSATIVSLDLPGLSASAFAVTTDGANTFVTTLCFAAGTRIATPAGERLVETLRPGDIVLAAGPDGAWRARTVRWVGVRRLDLTEHPDPELAAPIRIRAGALAPGLPRRDLVLSPDHCLLLDGHLLRAFRLINGVSVVQERPARVTYVHVELDRHALLLAEGVAAESYLDEGHRGFFAGTDALPGKLSGRSVPACAPFAPDDAFAERIWQRLAIRARAPAPRPRSAAALRVLAGTRPLRRVAVQGNRHLYALPPGTTDLRLVSPAVRPTDSRPWAEDRRRLGVRVAGIMVDGARLSLDGPQAVRGWWQAELDGCRWTDGDACLALPPGAALLEVLLHRLGASVQRSAATG